MSRKKSTAFTLIELCIVGMLIAIMVSVAIPNYVRAVERAKYAQCIAILKNLATAAADYYRENESFSGIVDISVLEDQAGAYFYSGFDNPDWRFTVLAITDRTFSIEAERTSSLPNNGQTVIIDELGHLSGTYNRADPAAGI